MYVYELPSTITNIYAIKLQQRSGMESGRKGERERESIAFAYKEIFVHAYKYVRYIHM